MFRSLSLFPRLLADAVIRVHHPRASLGELMTKRDHSIEPSRSPAGEPVPQPRKTRKEVDIPAVFQVVVNCGDERRQREVYERMTAEGFRCRLMLL